MIALAIVIDLPIVLGAVDFDAKLYRRAVEIEHVGTDGMLTRMRTLNPQVGRVDAIPCGAAARLSTVSQ